ncbi:MAG: UDP-glucose/GDP-mannose dehydrogenase family protein [Candidatus Omnitrophota bacterium]
MNICIIGAGYVGLVTGACFAELGHKVICVDSNREKIDSLKKGKIPFYEKGLDSLVRNNMASKNLIFSTSIEEGVKRSMIIFVCVGTPSHLSGEADLSYIKAVTKEVARCMTSYRLVVQKSTVPVETNRWVKKSIKANLRKKIKFDVASNPEFLKEGSAVNDFMNPDRIVLGVDSEKAKKLLLELYEDVKGEKVVTDIESAEIIKHASNSFLATKISFINSIADICEATSADVEKVAYGMGLDKRIGESFLNSGIGYGGSCFPKDIDAFIHIAGKLGYEFSILKAVKKVNEDQKKRFIAKIKKNVKDLRGKKIGVLGLSFKPETDDMRKAPSIDIIKFLRKEKALIKTYDPKAMDRARSIFNDIKFCKDMYEVASGVEALIIVTEWEAFEHMDLKRIKKLMKRALIIDGRNIFDPLNMKKLGIRYISMGRK